MVEGEHTIISKIPRERLNQIAGRKLAALAIPVRLASDKETLEGELPFSGKLAHPASGQPIPRARFVVLGHDALRFLDAPLAALPPVPFYDLERASALEQRVAEALQRRLDQLQSQAARLRALGLEVVADPDRLAARAVVRTPTHAFELLGADEGIRVSRVAPVGGRPFEVPATFPAVQPEDHGSRGDLEVWLAQRVPEMEAATAAAGRPAAAGGDRIEASPPPRHGLTLGEITRAFGPEGVLAPSAPVEVFQEFQHAGTHYRFVAVREVGTHFRGRVIGPAGDVWSDRFDLADFPGTALVVAAALGAGAQPASAAGASSPRPPPRLPAPGEVWAMNVVVESQEGEHIRYVGTDVDGRPYGAARVLRRPDFEAVFARHGSGWRLLVFVDQVQGDGVLYRQLDPQRQPLGAARRMAAAVLVANFVPEAPAP
ncbi:MAG TPA: hypothetical protein VH880_06050 [Anaeromyxobacteraceae bacterium]|jgi:hypothetical protein